MSVRKFMFGYELLVSRKATVLLVLPIPFLRYRPTLASLFSFCELTLAKIRARAYYVVLNCLYLFILTFYFKFSLKGSFKLLLNIIAFSIKTKFVQIYRRFQIFIIQPVFHNSMDAMDENNI